MRRVILIAFAAILLVLAPFAIGPMVDRMNETTGGVVEWLRSSEGKLGIAYFVAVGILIKAMGRWWRRT
jgi:hypothetical protein